MSLKNKVASLIVLLTLASSLSIALFQFQFTARAFSKEIDRSLQDASKAFENRVSEQNQLLLARSQYKQMVPESQYSDASSPSTDGAINTGSTKKKSTENTDPVQILTGLVENNYSFISEKDYSQIDIQVFDIDGKILFTPNSGAVKLNENMLKVFESKVPINLDLSIDGKHYRALVTSFNNTQAALFLRSYSEFDNFVAENLRFSFLALSSTLLIALILGLLAGQKVTQNINRVIEKSKVIAENNDYNVRFNRDLKGEAGELGKTLNLILDNLKLSREEQQRLIENANHELKTPLTSMLTNLSMLKRIEVLTAEDVREIIEELNKEGKELAKLVSELITLSRGEQVVSEPEEIEVGAKINELANKLTSRTGRRVEVVGESFLITWSIEDFEKVINNLIENANKFDKSELPIKVYLEEGKVTVEDNGAGFTEEEKLYALERFYRGSKAQEVEGSGLGLSIVDSILKKYNASIEIGNKRNSAGARVSILFQN